MGFCLFNNVAVSARHALANLGLERLLIVDFDVHHGNGTQEAFYTDPGVLYFSVHEYPFYPGTGSVEEVGEGQGEGTTVNVPLPAWCGDEEYRYTFEQLLSPVARRFRPQLVLVSAGYDAHWADPLGMMQLSTLGYASLTRTLKEMAEELCHGRLAFTLEGGYDLEALAHSIAATVQVLLGDEQINNHVGPSPGPGVPVDDIILHLKGIHRLV